MTTKTDRDAYIDRYDELSLIYGDPVEIMFEIASAKKSVEPGVRRAAASDLMSYRFPKTKAIDIQATLDAQAGFSFMMVPHDQAERVINGQAQDTRQIIHDDRPIQATTIEHEELAPDYIDPKIEFKQEVLA